MLFEILTTGNTEKEGASWHLLLLSELTTNGKKYSAITFSTLPALMLPTYTEKKRKKKSLTEC